VEPTPIGQGFRKADTVVRGCVDAFALLAIIDRRRMMGEPFAVGSGKGPARLSSSRREPDFEERF
jgi:hypothetical protein